MTKKLDNTREACDNIEMEHRQSSIVNHDPHQSFHDMIHHFREEHPTIIQDFKHEDTKPNIIDSGHISVRMCKP